MLDKLLKLSCLSFLLCHMRTIMELRIKDGCEDEMTSCV